MVHPIVAEILNARGVDAKAFWETPHGVTMGKVPGSLAIEIWRSLRAAAPQTAMWPVIRGGENEELDASLFDPAEIISSAPRGDIWNLLSKRLAERIESFRQFAEGLRDDIDVATFIAKVDASGAMIFRGTDTVSEAWPTSPPQPDLSVHLIENIGRRESRRTIHVALVPCAYPHEIPAYFGFGGWNDAPEPELQVAVLRAWERDYGAVPIALSGDVLEFVVDRPPQTEAAAMELAAQQWIFCDDIVSQGTQTVRKLGIEIWKSPHWFFWWD